MVKPPKIRHSKLRKEPLTIELGPEDVSRIEEPRAAEAAPQMAEPGPEATPTASDETVPSGDESKAETVADAEQAATAETGTASDEPAEAEPGETPDAKPAADKSAEDETVNFMGSEWPPEPASNSQTPQEEERVPHAFGRDPGTPPPFRHADRAQTEGPIRTPQAEQRKGFGASAIAAGIIGGVITLLGAGGLQLTGVLPSPGPGAPADNGEVVSAVKAEVAALRQELDAVKAGSGNGDTAALSQSVTDMQGGLQGLTAGLDQVKADVAALKDAVAQGSAGDGAAVQALNQKLSELEASVTTLKDTVAQGSAGDGAAVQALNQKLSELEASVTTLKDTVAQGSAGDGAAVQALNQRLAELQASVAALQQTGVSQETIDAINQKLAAVETATAAADEAVKAADGRIGALEQNVSTLSEQVASVAGQPKVALAIAAAALKSAVERGGTFTAEVETFAAIAPNSPELPALREIAAKGVASRTELAEATNDAANAMVAAAAVPAQDVGFWDSLWSSAESLVTVRPIGEVEGQTVPAKVARMEVAVKAGDFVKALAEYDTLPDAAKAAGKAFADRVRDRVAAEELITKALAGALNPA